MKKKKNVGLVTPHIGPNWAKLGWAICGGMLVCLSNICVQQIKAGIKFF